MTRNDPAALRATRQILRLLTGVNLVYGALILALLAASLIAPGWVMRALGVRAGSDAGWLFAGMRMVMVLGIAGVPLTHVMLMRLREIVDTVRDGDPFVSSNAMRLRSIAWALLALEGVHLAVGLVGAAASTAAQSLDLDWSFSLTRWLAALFLFVLAQVFERGALMREELEGTV